MVFTTHSLRQAASLLALGALSWCALCTSDGRVRAEPPPAAHYTLTASLDPERHVVHGEAVIVLENRLAPMEELWLQLYGNARRGPGSVYQQGETPALEARSQIELSKLQVAGEDRLEDAQLELLPGDFTRLRLPLSTPLQTGESLQIEVTFETHLGTLSTRSGYQDDFHVVAQWYPKLAHRDQDGVWRAHPFERMGEFRADHAHFELTVQPPDGYLVDGAGARSETVAGVHLVSSPALDIAWAACRQCTAVARQHGMTQVRGLHALGTRRAAARQLDTVRRGLDYLGATLGPYPYETLTVVTTPRGSPAAGMEYPALIVTPPGSSPLRSSPYLDGRHVVAHELAHQWFYAQVASDELRWPVLDEGLTEWAASDLMGHLAPLEALAVPSAFNAFDVLRAASLAGQSPPPAPGLPAYRFGEVDYGRSVYARAALALESVRRSHGDVRFRQALKGYVRNAAFSHATPESLSRAFDAAYGVGFFQRNVAPLLLAGESSEVHLSQVRARDRGGSFHTQALAHRSGGASLPTWVALLDEQGQQLVRLAWPAEQAVLEIDAHTHTQVHAIEIDPDRALLTDSNRLDQRWHADAPARSKSWTAWLFVFAQALLMGWGP